MNEEDVKKFFEEIGLTKGLENMKKFQEEFIDKHYIEKKKVKETIDKLKDRLHQEGYLDVDLLKKELELN